MKLLEKYLIRYKQNRIKRKKKRELYVKKSNKTKRKILKHNNQESRNNERSYQYS